MFLIYRKSFAKARLLTLASVIALSPGLANAAAAEEEQTQEAGSDGERRSDRSSNDRGSIVVTGQSLETPVMESPLPVILLADDALVHRRRGTLGETLEGLPGVHMDNFGGAREEDKHRIVLTRQHAVSGQPHESRLLWSR